MKKIKFLFLILYVICFTDLYSQNFMWRLLPASPGFTGGGRFEDIHFINSTTGWVVGYSGQVYRTTNGGLKFDTVFTSVDGSAIRSVGFFDSNTGLFGTLFNDTTRLLYRTTNGGFNWTAVNNITGSRPRGICGISIATENVAFACGRYYGSGRIIKTTDQGISWNVVFNDSSLARTLIDCYFWSADSGIAVGGYNISGYENGNAIVLRTINGGTTWQRVHKTNRTGEWCWKISFVTKNVGYVSMERFSGFAYILKTTNNGVNWNEIPFRNYDEEGIGFINENTGWIGGWTGPTYQTTNSGANWQLAGWGTNLNRFRFLSDTLAYAVGDRVYKYSRGPVGINLISNGIPNSINLSQNYPNPFNPSTKINFEIPETGNSQASNVKLNIFDILGKEVAVIVNEILSPGSYEVEFNAENLPSGVYFYKLEMQNIFANSGTGFTEIKKMILMK